LHLPSNRIIFISIPLLRGAFLGRLKTRGGKRLAARRAYAGADWRRLKSLGSGEPAARHKGLPWRLRLDSVPTRVRRSREGPPAEDRLGSPPGIRRRKAENQSRAGCRFAGFARGRICLCTLLIRAEGRDALLAHAASRAPSDFSAGDLFTPRSKRSREGC